MPLFSAKKHAKQKEVSTALPHQRCRELSTLPCIIYFMPHHLHNNLKGLALNRFSRFSMILWDALKEEECLTNVFPMIQLLGCGWRKLEQYLSLFAHSQNTLSVLRLFSPLTTVVSE